MKGKPIHALDSRLLRRVGIGVRWFCYPADVSQLYTKAAYTLNLNFNAASKSDKVIALIPNEARDNLVERSDKWARLPK